MERPMAEVIALSAVLGAELELSVGIDVKSIVDTSAELHPLAHRFGDESICLGALDSEFWNGLFNGCNIILR